MYVEELEQSGEFRKLDNCNAAFKTMKRQHLPISYQDITLSKI